MPGSITMSLRVFLSVNKLNRINKHQIVVNLPFRFHTPVENSFRLVLISLLLRKSSPKKKSLVLLSHLSEPGPDLHELRP